MDRHAFTTLELLIVIAVIGILAGLLALDVRPLNNAARNAANEVAATVKLTRSRAMATTSAHRLVAVGPNELRVESAVTCSDQEANWSTERGMEIELRDSAQLHGYQPGEVIVCFTSRGLANSSPSLQISDSAGRKSTLEIFAGGATEVR